MSQLRRLATSDAVALSRAFSASTSVSHGGLQDKDRIFTNIYGEHDIFINGAMKRGDWYRYELLFCGPDDLNLVANDQFGLGRNGTVNAAEQRTYYSWVVIGLWIRSRSLAFEGGEVQAFRRV
jgi:hypothetical protein